MLLTELAACVEGAKIIGEKNGKHPESVEILGLSTDSRFVKTGDLFFAIAGGKVDSHAFAEDAAEKGAAAIVAERELGVSLPQILVPDSRLAMSLMSAAFYSNPADKLKIIGITGTNGKTTTSYMLASILKRAGKKVGIIGTLGIFYGKKQIAPDLTTPDPVFLHATLADMLKCGVEYAVMEISAHALYYKKDAGLRYAVCVFTNCTQDHLDFFGSMKNYRQAKKSLFFPERCPIAVINGDDKTGREIGAMRAGERSASGTDGNKTGSNGTTGANGTKTVYYALESPADAFAVITSEELGGSEFMLNLSDNLCRISLSLTGRHNVYNAMAAAEAAHELGISVSAIAGGLKDLKRVSGRLERVSGIDGAEIFVDFAHTPDGLEKSLSALRGHCKGRLICLFGCGGNRDKTKRPLMGETVAKKADFSVLTSDNPRWEDPVDVISQIEAGYRRFSTAYVVIPERKCAISYAVALLKKGDVLLVAGKGGEDYQEIMGIKYAYNDNAVIEEALTARRKATR